MSESSEYSPAKLRNRLCVVEFLYNCSIACDSFLTVFLQGLGVMPGTLGIINSIHSISGVVAPPVWGVLADKIGSCKRIFILCLLVAAGVLFFMPLASTSPVFPIVFVVAIAVIASFFSGPANSMMESWLAQVSSNSNGKISYGSIRLWASAGYAAMGLALTPLLKKVDVSVTYYLYGLFALPAILLARPIPDSRVRRKEKAVRLSEMPFKKIASYWLITYVLFLVFFNLPVSWCSQFFPYLVSDFGGGAAEVALFMGIRAFSEVPMLFLSKKIVGRFGLIKPLFAVAAMLTGSLSMYAFAQGMSWLIVGQILQGMASGLLMSCRIQYVYQLAPEGLEATTLALVNSVNVVISILLNLVIGFVLEGLGTKLFYLGADLMLIAATVLFALTIPFGLRVLKLKEPKAFSFRG